MAGKGILISLCMVLSSFASPSVWGDVGAASNYGKIYSWAPNAYRGPMPVASGEPDTYQIGVAHSRANDIRSLMIGYLSDKISHVAHLRNGSHVDDSLRNLLGDFCLRAEGPGDCADRYVRIQTPILYNLQKGMLDSASAEADLNCTYDQNGACTNRTTVAGRAGNSRPQMGVPLPKQDIPYLPTYKDLQGYALIYKDRIARPLSQEEYRLTIDQMLAAPQKSDFIKFKSIPRDPTDPQGQSWLVPDKNPDGTFKLDEQQYQLALDAWKRDQIDQAGNPDKAAFIGSVPTLNEDRMKAINRFATQMASPDPLDTETDYYHYAQGRGGLVKSTSDLLKQTRPIPAPSANGGQTGQNPAKPGAKTNTTTTGSSNSNSSNFSQVSPNGVGINQRQTATLNFQPAATKAQPQAYTPYSGTETVDVTGQTNANSISVRYRPEDFTASEILRRTPRNTSRNPASGGTGKKSGASGGSTGSGSGSGGASNSGNSGNSSSPGSGSSDINASSSVADQFTN